jgi:hypothetical protein
VKSGYSGRRKGSKADRFQQLKSQLPSPNKPIAQGLIAEVFLAAARTMLGAGAIEMRTVTFLASTSSAGRFPGAPWWI